MKLSFSRYRLRNTVIAGGLALAGAILVFIYVAGYRDDVEGGAKLTEVFVASRDIPEGTNGSDVAGSYLKKETVLRRNVVDGAIASPDRVLNLATSHPILEGEQITVRQFHSAAAQGVLANISKNFRAMTVSGDTNSLLAGIVDDGDHVDVVANITYTVRTAGTGGDLRRVATRIILRNILVLRAPAGETSSGIGGGADTTSMTLAVTDSQAQKMLFAIKNGSWWLVLRPVSAPADSPETVETIESILGDGLGPGGIDQLTSGNGAGSISSGN